MTPVLFSIGVASLCGIRSRGFFLLTLLANGGNAITHKVAATRNQQGFEQGLLVDSHITHLRNFLDDGDSFRNIGGKINGELRTHLGRDVQGGINILGHLGLIGRAVVHVRMLRIGGETHSGR